MLVSTVPISHSYVVVLARDVPEMRKAGTGACQPDSPCYFSLLAGFRGLGFRGFRSSGFRGLFTGLTLEWIKSAGWWRSVGFTVSWFRDSRLYTPQTKYDARLRLRSLHFQLAQGFVLRELPIGCMFLHYGAQTPYSISGFGLA